MEVVGEQLLQQNNNKMVVVVGELQQQLPNKLVVDGVLVQLINQLHKQMDGENKNNLNNQMVVGEFKKFQKSSNNLMVGVIQVDIMIMDLMVEIEVEAEVEVEEEVEVQIMEMNFQLRKELNRIL